MFEVLKKSYISIFAIFLWGYSLNAASIFQESKFKGKMDKYFSSLPSTSQIISKIHGKDTLETKVKQSLAIAIVNDGLGDLWTALLINEDIDDRRKDRPTMHVQNFRNPREQEYFRLSREAYGSDSNKNKTRALFQKFENDPAFQREVENLFITKEMEKNLKELVKEALEQDMNHVIKWCSPGSHAYDNSKDFCDKYSDVIPQAEIQIARARVDEANRRKAQEEAEAEAQEIAQAENEEAESRELQEYNNDVQSIIALFGNIREYKINSDDTSVQQQYKDKKLKSKLVEINKKNKGKKLSLSSARLVDVEAETALTKEGKKKSEAILKAIKKEAGNEWVGDLTKWEENPILMYTVGLSLAMCPSCWYETGKYIAQYELAIPGEEELSGIIANETEYGQREIVQVSITKVYPNMDAAMKLKKDVITKINGSIDKVNYDLNSYSEKIILELK